MVKQVLAKTTAITPVSDGYDTPDDDIGGGATFIKFDAATQSLYFDRSGKPLPRAPWIAVQCRKEAIRWSDKKIIDRIDESQSPDMTRSIARSRKRIGKRVLTVRQNRRGRCNTASTSSIRKTDRVSSSAIRHSARKPPTAISRGAFNSCATFVANVVPVVELSSCTMKTRLGDLSRAEGALDYARPSSRL